MKSELQQKLEELALKRSKPFCYGCYEEAPTGRCKSCGSDDLMRLLPGVGCEYGTDWIIEETLRSELTPVNIADAFEDSVRECYPETVKVGWLELDTVTILREVDAISWRCAMDDWASQEADDGVLISFDNGSIYYWTSDLEELVKSALWPRWLMINQCRTA